MKIEDFEYYVDSKILERGKDLFEKGCVRHKDNWGANWYFEVKGTKTLIKNHIGTSDYPNHFVEIFNKYF